MAARSQRDRVLKIPRGDRILASRGRVNLPKNEKTVSIRKTKLSSVTFDALTKQRTLRLTEAENP